jgi:tRNA(Ile)-lysidine synthase TilS/MesJ
MTSGVPIICRRCVLSSAVPGITFDETGLCSICQQTPAEETLAARRQKSRQEMTREIDRLRGVRPYECIVAFSGGKDSSFALKTLIEDYRLRCLAVTIDNGFISDETFRNCKLVCDALGADHVVFRPQNPFMKKMYGISAVSESMHPHAAIQRASSICNSCITLINTHMLNIALQHRAPIVAGGYIGGQLPKDTPILKLNLRASRNLRSSALQRFIGHFGEEAKLYFDIADEEKGPAELIVINPMLGMSIGEEQIIDALQPLGWKRPIDTGLTSTNCRLNDLGVYIHNRRHGFHPYVLETADQVRHGLLSRQQALEKLAMIPKFQDIEWLAKKIGVGHNEI